MDDIILVLKQLMVIGAYSIIVLILFCIVLSILAVLAKALHDKLNKKGE